MTEESMKCKRVTSARRGCQVPEGTHLQYEETMCSVRRESVQ